jgi:hypothetical protein
MDLRTNRLIQQNAARQVAKAENLLLTKQIKSWSDLQAKLGITLDPVYTDVPFTYPNFKLWSATWKTTATARAEGQNLLVIRKAEDKPKLKVATTTETIGKVTLFPEQQSVTDEIKDIYWGRKSSRFVVQDGETGSGKTFVAAAIIHHIVKNKLWLDPSLSPLPYDLPYRILVLTPKVVVESYKRVLELFGLGDLLGHTIMVTSLSQMTSSFGQIFYQEAYDPYAEDPDEPIIKLNDAFVPFFVVLDEFHRLNNQGTKQTKIAMAFQEHKFQPYTLAMSATPWVTVNHSRLAVIASRREYYGMKISKENFNLFAKNVCAKPDKPNIEASKRLRAQLNDIIVSFPKVKWKSKAINQIKIVDFKCEAHKQAAEDAFEIYLEAKRKAGENTKFGRFEEFVAVGQYRKAVEPFRVPAMVEMTLDNLTNNKAVVIGAAFRKTVADAVFQLNAAGIPRSKMSIIWGGKREWNKSMLLSDEEMDELMARGLKGEQLDPYEIRQLKETLDYRSERILANETEDEQAARLITQKELGLLGSQSAAQRQVEIDRFQSGESLVCIFTLAAGGVGLSLDQCTPDLLPRVGYFTPSYSGPEFKQALGRTIRRATVEDVYQYMCYMRGTVEEYHVAPLVDRKLKCIAAVTGNVFNIFDMDTCAKLTHKYRTTEEAKQDAEDIDSQFQSYQDPTDETGD